MIGIELAKAGKGSYALAQTKVFEKAIGAGQQLDVELVKAPIALYGLSSFSATCF